MMASRVEDIDKHWGLLSWAFENFEERTAGDVTADELRTEVRMGDAQAWAALSDNLEVKAVAVTRVVGPNKRIHVDYCAGRDREDWQDVLMAEIERFGEFLGSNGIRVFGRTGWTPFLKGIGYRETHRIMEKGL